MHETLFEMMQRQIHVQSQTHHLCAQPGFHVGAKLCTVPSLLVIQIKMVLTKCAMKYIFFSNFMQINFMKRFSRCLFVSLAIFRLVYFSFFPQFNLFLIINNCALKML